MTTADYNECVDNYADGVYRFILKNIGDEEKARDVVQDSFEKMWVKVQEINAEKARSYLFTTAYRTMIDMIRKDQRQESLDENTFNKHSYTDQYFGLKEVIDLAVAKLPEVQRSVLLLRDYEGYSYKEIGEIAGISEAQVKVYIFRARKFLKNHIGSLDEVL